MRIYMLESKHWSELDESLITRGAIERLLQSAGNEATRALGYDATHINIVFKPNLPYVRKSMGVGGSTFDEEMLDMTFDPKLPYGVDKFKEYLRDSVFHEINHVVHYAFQPKVGDIMFWVIAEGLAVVFAREVAGANQPWNDYGDDETMAGWLDELRSAVDPDSEKWYVDHPDGRKNIAYKTGTWIVDRAIQQSGRSILELTKMNYKEIISLANV